MEQWPTIRELTIEYTIMLLLELDLSQDKAAEILGISPRSVRNIIKEYEKKYDVRIRRKNDPLENKKELELYPNETVQGMPNNKRRLKHLDYILNYGRKRWQD